MDQSSILGALGNIISFVYFTLAFSRTMWRINLFAAPKDELSSMGKIEPYFYVWGFFNFVLWFNYYRISEAILVPWEVYTSIGMCLLLSCLSLLLSMAGKINRQKVVKAFGVSLCVLGVALFAVYLFLPGDIVDGKARGDRSLKDVSMFTTLCMYLFSYSLLELKVDDTQPPRPSVISMDFMILFLMVGNSMTWNAYGRAVGDDYIRVANVVGSWIGNAQMLLFLVYHANMPKKFRMIRDNILDRNPGIDKVQGSG